MLISVIIPSRNRWLNLNNTLNALINQTIDKSEYEIIISDDNSDDETFKLYEMNRRIDGLHLKYVNNNTKPHSWDASIVRNLGASIASRETKAFIFVDSDVILPNTALQYYKDDFEFNPNRVIIGPYDFYREGNEIIQQADVRNLKFESVNREDTFNTIHDGLACFSGNILIPKDIFYKTGGYDEQTFIGLEDGEYGIRLWKAGIQFSYDNRLRGKHQWHEQPPDRFPNDMKKHIDKLNIKHFGTDKPDYGIIEASKDTYKEWGLENWSVPESWLKNQINFSLQINEENKTNSK